jgi:aminoglycoside phosphotransferase (APT) family kinase protein
VEGPVAVELLARGRDCDVFDRGDGTVLRRSRNAYDQGPEARVLDYVAEHGYPVPRVHALEADGRDLIMEKVAGPTMAQAVERRPWQARRIGAQLAELHARLHEIPGPDWLAAIDDGDRLLHFDLHPMNVILSLEGPVVIDWTNACRGRPAGDLGRAWALMAAADVEVSALLAVVVSRVRRSLVAGFLDAAGRDEARAGLALAVRRTLADPNISPAEKDRMRALLVAEGVGEGSSDV